MVDFPPKRPRRNADPTRQGNVAAETPAVSTGSGGLKTSLRVKKAGTSPPPIQKTNSAS